MEIMVKKHLPLRRVIEGKFQNLPNSRIFKKFQDLIKVYEKLIRRRGYFLAN